MKDTFLLADIVIAVEMGAKRRGQSCVKALFQQQEVNPSVKV